LLVDPLVWLSMSSKVFLTANASLFESFPDDTSASIRASSAARTDTAPGVPADIPLAATLFLASASSLWTSVALPTVSPLASSFAKRRALFEVTLLALMLAMVTTFSYFPSRTDRGANFQPIQQ
jgi:hypothetical protein